MSQTSERVVYNCTHEGSHPPKSEEFFVFVEVGMVPKFRKDPSIPLVNVVQKFTIFEGDNKGANGIARKCSKAQLETAFGTSKEDDIIKKIVMEGRVEPVKNASVTHNNISTNSKK